MRTLSIVSCAAVFLVSVASFGQKTPAIPKAKLKKPAVGAPVPAPAVAPVIPTPRLEEPASVLGTGAEAAAGGAATTPASDPVVGGDPVAPPAPSTTEASPTSAQAPTDATVLRGTPSEQREIGRHVPVLISYLPVDLIIPSKLGVTVGYAPDTLHSYELEFVKARLTTPWLIADLGGITDERMTLLKRQRVGHGNFFVSYGLSYMDIDANLGNKYLNDIPGAPASVHILRVESLGAHVGIGHRWDVWKGLLVGVDWVDYTQPLIVTRRESLFLDYAWNQSARDDVQSAMRWLTYFPRLTFLKLQVGWEF